MTAAAQSTRAPAFRLPADLEFKVLGVALGGLLDARRDDRTRAVRAALVLEQVADLPSPGVAQVAAKAAQEIRAVLGHPPASVRRTVERARPPSPAAVFPETRYAAL